MGKESYVIKEHFEAICGFKVRHFLMIIPQNIYTLAAQNGFNDNIFFIHKQKERNKEQGHIVAT